MPLKKPWPRPWPRHALGVYLAPATQSPQAVFKLDLVRRAARRIEYRRSGAHNHLSIAVAIA